jgi:acetyl esterase/lipase
MFNLQNTFDELMSNEAVWHYVKQFIPAFILDSIRPELREKTLAELKEAVRLPWGAGFPSEDVLVAANFALELDKGDKYEIIPLWKQPESNSSVYLIAPSLNNCLSGTKKPVAVICPGGAYSSLAMPSEGIAYADALKEEGYVPFVLAYSVAPDHYPKPHMDLALAIKFIRKNADVYGLDPDDLMLIGSSAGGHLCASFAASPDEYEDLLMRNLEKMDTAQARQYRGISVKPQKITLGYPAISFMDLPVDDPCYYALTRGEKSLKEKLSVETQVTTDYPKTFIWACADDDLVPAEDHAKRLYKALTEQNVQSKLCIYPTGGHGCGLGNGTSAKEWLNTMLDYMK